ncbi:unnamed protein product [Ectocarpus sp. CCAP 1310/34]|nr:unnamed protein product [Ectocarpus sp. CCAP 1310/34]
MEGAADRGNARESAEAESTNAEEGHRGPGVRRAGGTCANLFESLARQGDTAAKQGALSPKR